MSAIPSNLTNKEYVQLMYGNLLVSPIGIGAGELAPIQHKTSRKFYKVELRRGQWENDRIVLNVFSHNGKCLGNIQIVPDPKPHTMLYFYEALNIEPIKCGLSIISAFSNFVNALDRIK